MALPALLCAVVGPGDGAARPASSAHGARDDAWVAGVRAGDVAAFEALFTAYVTSLIRFAASYVDDADGARELVDDVFFSIWKHRATWAPTDGAAAYLFGAVRHRALNYLRARRRHEHRIAAAAHSWAGESTPADAGLDAESDAAAVDRLLAALPEQRRRIMAMRWREEMTPEEIAAALGVSRNAVYLSLQRSLETLRALFGPGLR